MCRGMRFLLGELVLAIEATAIVTIGLTPSAESRPGQEGDTPLRTQHAPKRRSSKRSPPTRSRLLRCSQLSVPGCRDSCHSQVRRLAAHALVTPPARSSGRPTSATSVLLPRCALPVAGTTWGRGVGVALGGGGGVGEGTRVGAAVGDGCGATVGDGCGVTAMGVGVGGCGVAVGATVGVGVAAWATLMVPCITSGQW